MGEKYIFALLAVIFGFLASGLAFGLIRSRQTGEPHVLFWKSRLSPRARAFTKNMFFQGLPAEVSRILLLAIVAVMFALEVLR